MRAMGLLLTLLLAACGSDDSNPAPAETAQPVVTAPPAAQPTVPEPQTPPAVVPPVGATPPSAAAPPPPVPVAPVNKAPVIQSVSGPSNGLPGELVTLDVEWTDDDGDDVAITVEQLEGADTEFTSAGDLVMFEVPDIEEGAIFFRVLVSDGEATTTGDFRFYVLPAPVRYSIHRIPDTLGDDRVGTVRPRVINNDGHVGGAFEWATELEWDETDPPWPNWTGVIWLEGAPSLTDVNNWFHDELLLHIGDVYLLTDDFEVAGVAQDFAKTDEFDQPSSYNYTWDPNNGLEIFWDGLDLFGDGRKITSLNPAFIAPNGDVIGFDSSEWTTMFRWDGDAVHLWCYRDTRFPETQLGCPETPGFSETECIASLVDARGELYEWEYTTCPSRYTHLFEEQLGPFGEVAFLFLPAMEGHMELRLDVQRIVDMNDHDTLLVEGCLVELKPEAEGLEPWWQPVECGSYVLALQ